MVLAHCFRSYFTKAIAARNVINDATTLPLVEVFITKQTLLYYFFVSE